MNPYWGLNFFEFIQLFLSRCRQLLFGGLPIDQLAADEVQVFVLCLMGISSALVGSFLVLKKMTMLANSLSHTILLGIVIAYVLAGLLSSHPQGYGHQMSLWTLLLAALLTALLTTVLTQGLVQWMKLQEDASIGLVFTTLFAMGVILVTCLTRNTHIGTEVVMGNVDALHVDDLKLAVWIAGLNIGLVLLFFKEFKLVAFDASLAAAVGLSASKLNYLFMTMTALTVIGAFRAVGVLLVLALLVGPVLIARLYVNQLRSMIGLSMGIGVLSSLLAVALARHLLSVYQLPLSTAGILVALIGVEYFISLICLRKRFTC